MVHTPRLNEPGIEWHTPTPYEAIIACQWWRICGDKRCKGTSIILISGKLRENLKQPWIKKFPYFFKTLIKFYFFATEWK